MTAKSSATVSAGVIATSRPLFFLLGLQLLANPGCTTGDRGHGGDAGGLANVRGSLSGSVTYRERMALPSDAALLVQLSDISIADAPAPVIAETTLAVAGRQVPLPFELGYDTGRVDSNRTYAVRATIRSGGRMIFTTDTAHHVITRGNPSRVELLLVHVSGSDSVTTSGTVFRAPPSQAGRLLVRDDSLRFIACGEGMGTVVRDLASGEGRLLVRELGAGTQGITVLVRLDGDRLREIRYAGPEGPTFASNTGWPRSALPKEK